MKDILTFKTDEHFDIWCDDYYVIMNKGDSR